MSTRAPRTLPQPTPAAPARAGGGRESVGASSGPRRRRALRGGFHPALWSALAAIALYLPTLRHGFVWDDHWLIEANPPLHAAEPGAWGGLARLLLSDFWTPSGSPSGYWRPLVVAWYWIDGAVSHWNPAWFHAVNSLAHAGASALVALLVLESGAPAAGALAGGLLFAAMPAHVEPVAWVSGRTDLACALLVLLALWLDRRARARGRSAPGAGPVALFALALLGKETAIVFPAVVAVAEWCDVTGPGSGRARARWLAPYAGVAALWLAAHLLATGLRPPTMALDPAQAARVPWAAVVMLPGYLAFLWPWASHAPGPTLELPAGPLDPAVIGATCVQLAFVAGLAVLAARRARLAPPLALFWLALLPTAALALTQSTLLYAERFLYLPSAGIAWALGLAVAAAGSGRGGRLVGGLALALVAASAFVTTRLVPAWKDDATLFDAMARARPRNALAHASWGILLVEEGREGEARAELGLAERLNPRLPEVGFGRALLHYRHGRWAEAVASADSSIALDAGRIEARMIRARALMRLGRAEEAGSEIAASLERAPGHPLAESAWGQYLLVRSRPAEALPYLERAARSVHGDPDLEYGIGMASATLGRLPEARAAFARAVAADSTLYEGWLNLAVACHMLGDGSARDRALARAAALPEAGDGRVERTRARLTGRGP